MNYTKEMQQSNIPPEVGMKFICNDFTDLSRIKEFKGQEVEVIGVCESGCRAAITFQHKTLGIGCGFFDPCWVKPIDTRTDTEKAVDSINKILTDKNNDITCAFSNTVTFGSESITLLERIKEGKITGVKWVGND